MKNSFKKLALVIASFVFAFAVAEKSISLDFVGETRVTLPAEGPAVFYRNGSIIDTGEITLKAVIDNVTAQVKLAKDDDGGADSWAGTQFDSAYIEVADLFDGLLTLKFFDIGYGAGKDDSIRADLGAHGIYINVKPIDILSIGVGYGIAAKGFRAYTLVENTTLTNNLITDKNNSGQDGEDAVYHAIKVDVGIPNAFVPVDVYFGTVILDGATAPFDYKNRTEAVSFVSNKTTTADRVGIYLMQAGVSLDALAFLKAGALKLDLGLTLPIGSATKVLDSTTDADFKKELNFIAILYGGVADLGVEGLGLDYYLHYALDTKTKQTTLGDLDDDYFPEQLLVSVTPSYTLGQFKFSTEFRFGMIGKNTATFSTGDSSAQGALYTKAYNSLRIVPEVVWNVAEGTSVGLYYRYNDGNLDAEKDEYHRIGMTYSMSFGVSSE